MALSICGECNRQIADRAGTCPQCGRPIRPVFITDPPEVAPYQPIHIWRAVGITVAVAGVLLVVMGQIANRQEARRGHQAQLTALQADREAARRIETELQRLQEEARAGGKK
jgi:hypothetical protein